MQSKKMLQTIGLLLVLMGSYTSANAAIIHKGPFFGGGDLGSLNAGNTYTFAGASLFNPGSFEHTYSFSLAGQSSLDIGLADINFGQFINGTASLLSLNGNPLSGVNSFFNNLTPGSYLLKISGNASGFFGSAYNATMNVAAVAAVPEPEEWAMLLAGLGLVALKFSRLRKEDLVSTKLDVSYG